MRRVVPLLLALSLGLTACPQFMSDDFRGGGADASADSGSIVSGSTSGSGSDASSSDGSSSSGGSSGSDAGQGSSSGNTGSSGGIGSGSGSSGGEPQAEASVSQDASSDATTVCITDLSNVGTGDFHIVFDVASTSSATTTAFVNQRTGCSYGTYWDVRMSNGQAFIEMDNGTSANYTGYVVASATGINDGRTHSVNVSRVAGVLAISVDGTTPGTHAFADAIGALPALKIAQDACTNAASNSAIITNLCITRQ